MKRSAAVLLTLAAATTVTPAHAGGGCRVRARTLPETVTTAVSVRYFCWSPGAAVVAPGATVTFSNPPEGMDHNLSGPGIPYDLLPPGTARRVRFDAPGLYPYQCTIHIGMAGVVVVRDAATPTAVPAAAPPAATPAAATTPAPAPARGGGALPWAAGAAVLAAIGAGAFARRARGVPVPAR